MRAGSRIACLAAIVLLAGACNFFDSASAPKCEPAQIAPAEGDVLDNGCFDRSDELQWDFSWARCDDADRYHLYVIGPGAAIPIIDDRDVPRTTYEYRSAGFIAEHNRVGWTWKVRAHARGGYGPWSPNRTFDVEPRDTDCPDVR